MQGQGQPRSFAPRNFTYEGLVENNASQINSDSVYNNPFNRQSNPFQGQSNAFNGQNNAYKLPASSSSNSSRPFGQSVGSNFGGSINIEGSSEAMGMSMGMNSNQMGIHPMNNSMKPLSSMSNNQMAVVPAGEIDLAGQYNKMGV